MNYLLIGPEEYLKRQFLGKLKKSVLGETGSETDLGIFTAGSTPISEILAFLNTMPFTSKKRLAILNNIDEISTDEKDSLVRYLSSPRESSVLVMKTSSRESRKSAEKIFLPAKIIKCDRLKEREVGSWIQKEFAARGKKISPPAAALIAEFAGNDLLLLKNEIEKIAAFALKSAEITEKHVEEICLRSAYKTAFELIDMVLGKKLAEALLPLRDLSAGEKSHRMLNLLAWQFRAFMKIKNLPKGLSRDEISRLSGVKKYFLEKTIRESGRFTVRQLAKNLEIILEADFFIKNGKMSPQHAFERVLVGLCAG